MNNKTSYINEDGEQMQIESNDDPVYVERMQEKQGDEE